MGTSPHHVSSVVDRPQCRPDQGGLDERGLDERGGPVKVHRVWLAVGTAVYLAVLVRTAWQADDAFAAWRLIGNFVNGEGLCYNIGERVQTFTSVSWTFLIAGFYYFTREPYYTATAVSFALSVAALWMVAHPKRRNPLAIVFVFGAATLSIAFVDFSAAGFENPLSHFVLALFALQFFRRSPFTSRRCLGLVLTAAFAGLTRLDSLAYYIPCLGYALVNTPVPWRQRLRLTAAGFAPLALWHAFALFYFGFPLQNAAYAKRFNNLPTSEYLRAGADYFLNSFSRDPLTLFLIGLGLLIGFQSRDAKLRCFAAGVGLFLAYVLLIGGCYMSGRWFTIAYLGSLILILRSDVLSDLRASAMLLPTVMILACLSRNPTFLTDRDYGLKRGDSETSEWNQRGIADERASWYQHSGLLLSSRWDPMPRPLPEWDFIRDVQRQKELVEQAGKSRFVGIVLPTGYYGYYAPRDWHIYDTNGQVDPLMARIPCNYGSRWRQGHLFKPLPEGYQLTLETGRNHIADPDLARYYDDLKLVVSGDLWSAKRFKAILRLNLGWNDHLLRSYAARRDAPPRSRSAAQIAVRPDEEGVEQ